MPQKKTDIADIRAKKYKGIGLTKSEQVQHQKWDKQIAKQKKETARIKRVMKIDKALGDKKGFMKSSKKVQKEMRKLAKMPMGRKVVKKIAKKSISRRLIGKSLSKFMPGAGVATAALYVIEGVSKATCSKKGGKWVSGKCKGVKKDTRKMTSPQARDLKSKR